MTMNNEARALKYGFSPRIVDERISTAYATEDQMMVRCKACDLGSIYRLLKERYETVLDLLKDGCFEKSRIYEN